jgi:UDP-glucuronate 4-epimerase
MGFDQQTILVTGGAGFIGSHLVERLLQGGQGVICLDNFDYFYDRRIKQTNLQKALNEPNFTLVEGDIRDMECLKKLFSENRIKKVVHLAARAGVRASIANPQLYEEVNIKGTLNLLEVCKEFPVEQFIFGSSSSVYGINSKVPFSEDDKIEMPISPYAASKRAGELFCYTYHHLYGIPITCLRFFTCYGERQRKDMAIHKFTWLIDEGKELTMFGDGSSKRDYTYISDIIDGIMATFLKPFEFEIINLGDSQTVELRHLIDLIEQALGKKANINQLPLQPGDVSITFADISKARALLGYIPKVDIETGIRKFVMWYQNNKVSDLSEKGITSCSVGVLKSTF